MSVSDSSCPFFNIPDEILTEIILYLNTRERNALAYTSERLFHLVFEEGQFLRCLDFSQEGRLTSLADIKRYFNNPKRSERVLKLDLRNVTCLSTGQNLENLLSLGRNLVDINVQTIKFENISHLGSFLKTFKNLKRLSIDWPKQKWGTDENYIDKVVAQSLARLRYLSIRVLWQGYASMPSIVAYLSVCLELRELRIFQMSVPGGPCPQFQNVGKNGPLKHLGIFEYCGYGSQGIFNQILPLLEHPEEWMEFTIKSKMDLGNDFYLEKKPVDFQKRKQSCIRTGNRALNWDDPVLPVHFPFDSMLLEVLMTTHYTDKGDLCCLQKPVNGHERYIPCLVKNEEIKSLLGPRHNISYLNISHRIEPNCSVHLIASAFPNLTELVLENIVKIKGDYPSLSYMKLFSSCHANHYRLNVGSTTQNTHVKKRLVKKGEPETEDYWNVNEDSSFKMLVDNTPHLRNFTLYAKTAFLRNNEVWDVDALPLIAGWRKLRSLCLMFVPITDGEFLVEIGKQCVHLEKLELQSLGPLESCCFDDSLKLMLVQCENLRDFTIRQKNMDHVSELLQFLAHHSELKRVSVRSGAQIVKTEESITHIGYLLQRCSKLTTFFYVIGGMPKIDSDKLKFALRRFRTDLSRPTLQFQVVNASDAEDVVHEDYSPPSFPTNLQQFLNTEYFRN